MCSGALDTMLQCPSCLNDQLHRVQRTAFERILFRQSYECRMCGRRSHVARRLWAATLEFLTLTLRSSVRITDGPRERRNS
jgi:hypothetical protein